MAARFIAPSSPPVYAQPPPFMSPPRKVEDMVQKVLILSVILFVVQAGIGYFLLTADRSPPLPPGVQVVTAPVGRWSEVVPINVGRCMTTDGAGFKTEYRSLSTGSWSISATLAPAVNGMRFQSLGSATAKVKITEKTYEECMQSTVREVLAPVGRWSEVVSIPQGSCFGDSPKVAGDQYTSEHYDGMRGMWGYHPALGMAAVHFMSVGQTAVTVLFKLYPLSPDHRCVVY